MRRKIMYKLLAEIALVLPTEVLNSVDELHEYGSFSMGNYLWLSDSI